MGEALLVFVLALASDLGWARYITTVAQGDRVAACLWSACLMVLSLCLVYCAVTSLVLILPAALGAMVGTWLGTEAV